MKQKKARQEWPAGYVQSFSGMPDDFKRLPQGELEKRKKFVPSRHR